VPPIANHSSGGATPGSVSAMTAPVNGSANHEISGSNRAGPGSPFWKAGLAKKPLAPPPDPA
jgi:hypothetical protein